MLMIREALKMIIKLYSQVRTDVTHTEKVIGDGR